MLYSDNEDKIDEALINMIRKNKNLRIRYSDSTGSILLYYI